MRLRHAIFAAPILLSGCVHGGLHLVDNPPTPSDLIQEIKYEIGTFAKSPPPGVSSVCGDDFAMVVSKVHVKITSVLKSSNSFSAGAELPIGTGSLSPSIANDRSFEGTTTTEFTVFPKAPGSETIAAKSPRFEGTPLLDALRATRKALVDNAAFGPCMTFGDPTKQENTVSYAFTVSDKTSVGGKFKILVFSLGDTFTKERGNGNDITVTFDLSGQALRTQ